MAIYGIDSHSRGHHLLTVAQTQVDAYDGEAIIGTSPDGRVLVLRWPDGNVTVKVGPDHERKILHTTFGGGLFGPVIDFSTTYGEAPGLPYLSHIGGLAPAQPSAAPAPGCMVTTRNILNLRAGPSQADAIIDIVPYNATLTVLGRAPGWVQVDYHGTAGWLSAEYSTDNGACG